MRMKQKDGIWEIRTGAWKYIHKGDTDNYDSNEMAMKTIFQTSVIHIDLWQFLPNYLH